MFVVTPEAGGAVLGDGERDHLAADLGETFEPALDSEVAFLVGADDVAGVVPATGRRLQLARLCGREIAFHDIWTAHEHAAAMLDAGYRFETDFHTRQDASDRAGTIVAGLVHRDDG